MATEKRSYAFSFVTVYTCIHEDSERLSLSAASLLDVAETVFRSALIIIKDILRGNDTLEATMHAPIASKAWSPSQVNGTKDITGIGEDQRDPQNSLWRRFAGKAAAVVAQTVHNAGYISASNLRNGVVKFSQNHIIWNKACKL